MGGTIDYRVEKDRFENDVSIITLDTGRKFRLVHHTVERHYRQKGTIFAGRGKYVNTYSFFSDNDNKSHIFEIGGYAVHWGDGEVFRVQCPEICPDLTEELRKILDDDEEAVIFIVLQAIENQPQCWKKKS